ncbi:exopolysaccharide biosynthesis protein YbjH [Thiogranum longum]|uniref:Exopolysaccharide biosynthesis protein YbjH n=1 Tax=Thiogranum longum TaxID=1537524 RepID=A0A4R1HC47_9GAMM|nr:YjbH domain-containing protein [Thiogranum longum]TCK18113.1 exopolysaccharide biosynthesis protein YbjH [Thiogranum longum]
MSRNWLNVPLYLMLAVIAVFACPVSAEPSTTGQTGLINMPDARFEEEGTFRLGTSYFRPYLPIWSSISLLPRLELSARYTVIRGLSTSLGQGFGDYKDRAFDTKLLLWKENKWLPDFALGSQDFTGTGVFRARYAVASKRVGNSDYTLGYGDDRIDGVFGGVRHRFDWNKNLSVVVEYDANDYRNDLRASESGVDRRDGGWTYGVEYRKDWYGVQLATDGDDVGGNVYVTVPLMKPRFVPRFQEPAPYPVSQPDVTIDQWHADTDAAARLARELYRQEYKNIRLGFDGHTLVASLTNTRISRIGRAVGRAARVMLSLGPIETQALEITYTRNDMPLLTYRFSDTSKLRRYFQGLLSRDQLDRYLEITYTDPSFNTRLTANEIDIPAAVIDDLDLNDDVQRSDEGHVLSYRFESRDLSGFQFVPFNAGVIFNDRNGVARFNLFASANYTQQLRHGLFLETGAELIWYEDVSESSRGSNNSTLPHVRSDIARYLQSSRLKLTRLLVNQYFQPRRQVYARLSAGIYEMMFAGAGGQVLYLPQRGNWAADLSVDWLRQRDPDGGFAFRDYSTVTALGALHYRFPVWGVTATARAGRFLAKDKGVRFELKRRFRSGVTFGAWYTRTDGNDITNPGSPGSPYFDKGIFMSIPLDPLLTRDTRARSEFSLAPWARDVGQMVVSPGDLYTITERALLLDAPDEDTASQLGQ